MFSRIGVNYGIRDDMLCNLPDQLLQVCVGICPVCLVLQRLANFCDLLLQLLQTVLDVDFLPEFIVTILPVGDNLLCVTFQLWGNGF